MGEIAYIDIFNNKLLEFLGDLRVSFPHIQQFELYENLTKGCIMMSKTTAENIFHTTVVQPYGKHIDKKDEAFILGQEFDNADQSFVSLLKTVWKDLDRENKENVWKYVRLLVTLSRKIHN